MEKLSLKYTMLELLVALVTTVFCFTSASHEVYKGEGQISFVYGSSYTGCPVIYRPEKYRKYSPLGEGLYADIVYKSYNTEDDALGDRYNWLYEKRFETRSLHWSAEGKYYYTYYDTTKKDIRGGDWIAYDVIIYNDLHTAIYEEVEQYYQVPSNTDSCRVDEYASIGEIKCSELLEEQGLDTGLIVAAVLCPLAAIAVAIAIGVCIKKIQSKRCQRSSEGSTPTNEQTEMEAVTSQASDKWDPPSYTDAVSAPTP